MVNMMASPAQDYDYAEQIDCDDVDICDKHGDVEDGELPEEGEICDDDDLEDRDKIVLTGECLPSDDRIDVEMAEEALELLDGTSTSSSTMITNTNVDTRSAERGMLSSWMTGVKQRAKPGTTMTTALPTVDANEEYYGYGGSASTADTGGDKDYRKACGESTDKDYRWMREDDGHRTSGDPVNEFGDSDYRPPPKFERKQRSFRRRRSPTPSYGSKRPRHSPPVHGGYRVRNFRGRWGDRQICKFFREGYCRDGENCSYSHDAADSGRKPELCKFYQQGYCKKGLQCPLLHGEYPCKAFHKGECSKDPCTFSHLPLTNFTQPIFDRMIKDDELSSRIAIPQGPLKRRVLLPGGPSSSPTSQAPLPVIVTVTAADSGLCGVLPPPTIVVPTLSSTPPVPASQPQLVIPPTLTANHLPYPAFFPHHSIAAPSVEPGAVAVSMPAVPTPQSIPPSKPVAQQQYATNTEKRGGEEDEAFNINKMLEQITSKVKNDDAIDESPASPPMFNPDAVISDSAPTIPQSNTPSWKLIPVDNIPSPHVSFDCSILQMSLNDSYVSNDPRVKKALSFQFDSFTNSIMNCALSPATQLVSNAQQDGVTSLGTVPVPPVPMAAVAAKESTSLPKLGDPRVYASPDARKRTAASDPRLAMDHRSNPSVDLHAVANVDAAESMVAEMRTPSVRLRADSGAVQVFDPVQLPEQANGGVLSAQIPSSSVGHVGVESYMSSVSSIQNWDQDHRVHFPVYRDVPNAQDDRRAERSNLYDGRRSSCSSWMPQMHTALDPRQVKSFRYSACVYHSDYSNQDRDEREISHSHRSDETKKSVCSVNVISVASKPQDPLTLRK